jgi:predicted RNA binding protein YcfA (HicA-like mRNA interferase family)
MPKTFGEVRRRLGDAGFEVVRQSGSHQAWRHVDGRRVTVAGKDSKTVPAGTLASIRRATGLEDLR